MGALQLARFDARGLSRMDDTTRGVIISFAAPLLMLPLMMFLQSLSMPVDEPVPGSFSLLRDSLAYAVAVFGFPLAMYYLTLYMGRGARYFLMVTAVNWTAPWQSLIMGLGYFLFAFDVVPAKLANFLLLCASVFNVCYIWFTLRASLGISRGMAILAVTLLSTIQLIGLLFTQVKL